MLKYLFHCIFQSDNGGMCSPGGLSYVGRSKEGFGEIPAALACKRWHLDEAIAMNAKRYMPYTF